MMRFILMLTVVFCMQSTSATTHDNLAQTVAADKENLRLVMFFSHHCQWCQKQQKSVVELSKTLNIKTLGGTEDKVVHTHDFEEVGQDIEYFKIFRVIAYPSVFLWNTKTSAKHKLTEGYREADVLEARLHQALNREFVDMDHHKVNQYAH